MDPAKILIVEDEFLIRMMLAETLADAGFEVLEAEDAAAAEQILQQEAGIAALVTDLQLPGSRSGFDLAQLARQRQPELPVIYTTGHNEMTQAGSTSPPDVFVLKPYMPTEVCTLVRSLTSR